MNKKVLMKCGHMSNAVTHDGRPYCVICCCDEIDNKRINLKNRKAICAYCGKLVDSNIKLPFFEYKQNEEFDEYYCGCGGWD